MSVKKTKDGKSYCYWTQYTDEVMGVKKRQYKSGFKTLKEAKEAEREFIVSVQFSKSKELNFKTLVDDYLNHKFNKVEIITFNNNKREITKFILPSFEKKNVEEITRLDVRLWLDKLAKMNISIRYKNGIIQLFKSIFTHGRIFFNIQNDPCSFIELFKTKKSEVVKNIFWEVEEFKKFISVFDLDNENEYLWATFYTLLYWTGQRRGEIKALKFSDINFKEQKLSITKTASNKITGKGLQIRDTKNVSSRRVISIDDSTLQMLFKVWELRRKEKGFTEDEFIFIRNRNYRIPFADQTIADRKNRACKKAGVNQITIHQFRHSHASVLICNDVNIAAVSKRLGHSDINMTLKVYTHLIPSIERITLEAINKINK